MFLVFLSLLLLQSVVVECFVVPPVGQHVIGAQQFATTALFAKLPAISKMKASEMKKELESYGISTKSLLEKKEFQIALEKARKEGKTPVESKKEETKDEEPVNGESKAKSSSDGGESREEKYAKALEEAKSMKVGELKKALTDRGISTKSFFEKTEFVKAYADAIADGVEAKGSGGGASAGQGFGSGQQRRAPRQEEPRDPSYRDVNMQKFDRRQIIGSNVIDTSAR